VEHFSRQWLFVLQGKALELGMSSPSRLRILGGTARGKKLDSPSVYLRPMMGKVWQLHVALVTSWLPFEERACM
jgi:hypothetical protein